MTLKIALVGCGKIADGHVEEIQKLPTRARVVAVCDRDKSATTWGGNRFDNSKLKRLGWKQAIPTAEGLQRTFAWLRTST
jgi:predicted dehydrogenase